MKIFTDPNSVSSEARTIIYGPTHAEIDKILASFPLIPGRYDTFRDLQEAREAAMTNRYTSAIIAYSSMHVDAKELLDMATCGISGSIDMVCAAIDAIYDIRSEVWEIGENHLFQYSKEELDSLTLPLVSMTSGLSPINWISHIQTEFQQVVQRMKADKKRVAMIYGPSGSAKYALSQVAHLRSDHKHQPFVFANCNMELGKGDIVWDSMTRNNFKANIRTLLSIADNGTLFFHKIDHLDLEAQQLIVEVLSDPYYHKCGSNDKITYHGGVIFSTRHDIIREDVSQYLDNGLLKMVRDYAMRVPSLEENVDDVPLLASALLRNYCHTKGIEAKEFSQPALRALRNHGWARNIRELFMVIKSAVTITRGKLIKADAINMPSHDDKNESEHEKRSAIKAALKKHHGCIERAAKELGVTRKTLHVWIHQYNISLDFIEDLRLQGKEARERAKSVRQRTRETKKKSQNKPTAK